MTIVNALARRRALLFLLVATLLAGAAFGVLRAQPAEAAGPPEFTAVELADGVLFNSGPVAEYLTEIERNKFEWTDDARKTRELILRAVERDERFSKRFPELMQSGDPRLVDRAMADLGSITHDVLVEKYGQRRVDEVVGKIGKEWAEARIVQDVVLGQYAGVAVVLVVAVAAVVAAVALWVVGIEAKVPQLYQEMLTQQLASALAGGGWAR